MHEFESSKGRMEVKAGRLVRREQPAPDTSPPRRTPDINLWMGRKSRCTRAETVDTRLICSSLNGAKRASRKSFVALRGSPSSPTSLDGSQ